MDRTRGATLAESADVARGVFERMKGLLGRDALDRGEGLVIIPCSSVHTFGMRFSIDAVFFDSGLRVTAVEADLKPMRVSGWHPRASGVLELPAGTADRAGIRTGDQLEFVPVSERER